MCAINLQQFNYGVKVVLSPASAYTAEVLLIEM